MKSSATDGPPPPPAPSPREELEARLSALVLGESGDFEAETLRARLAADPDLAALHARLAAAAQAFKDTFEDERAAAALPPLAAPPERLSPERLAALEKLFAAAPPAPAAVATPAPADAPGLRVVAAPRAGTRRWWRMQRALAPMLAAAACAVFLAVVLLPKLSVRRAASKLSEEQLVLASTPNPADLKATAPATAVRRLRTSEPAARTAADAFADMAAASGPARQADPLPRVQSADQYAMDMQAADLLQRIPTQALANDVEIVRTQMLRDVENAWQRPDVYAGVQAGSASPAEILQVARADADRLKNENTPFTGTVTLSGTGVIGAPGSAGDLLLDGGALRFAAAGPAATMELGTSGATNPGNPNLGRGFQAKGDSPNDLSPEELRQIQEQLAQQSPGDWFAAATTATPARATSRAQSDFGAEADRFGNDGLAKSGAGQLTISGANTYTGATTTDAITFNGGALAWAGPTDQPNTRPTLASDTTASWADLASAPRVTDASGAAGAGAPPPAGGINGFFDTSRTSNLNDQAFTSRAANAGDADSVRVYSGFNSTGTDRVMSTGADGVNTGRLYVTGNLTFAANAPPAGAPAIASNGAVMAGEKLTPAEQGAALAAAQLQSYHGADLRTTLDTLANNQDYGMPSVSYDTTQQLSGVNFNPSLHYSTGNTTITAGTLAVGKGSETFLRANPEVTLGGLDLRTPAASGTVAGPGAGARPPVGLAVSEGLVFPPSYSQAESNASPGSYGASFGTATEERQARNSLNGPAIASYLSTGSLSSAPAEPPPASPGHTMEISFAAPSTPQPGRGGAGGPGGSSRDGGGAEGAAVARGRRGGNAGAEARFDTNGNSLTLANPVAASSPATPAQPEGDQQPGQDALFSFGVIAGQPPATPPPPMAAPAAPSARPTTAVPSTAHPLAGAQVSGQFAFESEYLFKNNEPKEIPAASAPSSSPPAVSPPAEPAPAEDQPVERPPSSVQFPPPVNTADNAFSTFALNVSDASYRQTLAALERRRFPDPASVRTEEFLNAFNYHDPAPARGEPCALAYELAQNPFEAGRDLLRVSFQTAAVGRNRTTPLRLTILLDNSGSMTRADRQATLNAALGALGRQLRPDDRVSLVTFARTPQVRALDVPAQNFGELAGFAQRLLPDGGTNVEEALRAAYAAAAQHYAPAAQNRVVFLTDGAANLGNVDPATLGAQAAQGRKAGIALDAYGVGWEGLDDAVLEALTRNSDGRYGFLNRPDDVDRAFARQLAGAFAPAAMDVKLQLEFNPRRVLSYRLMGYNNLRLTKEQFRDNTVDAGELAAAESGTALYSLVLDPQGSGPVATARARYRDPATGEYRELSWTIQYSGTPPAFDQAAPGVRLAATAAYFAEYFQRSPYAAEVTPRALLRTLQGVPESCAPDPRPAVLAEALTAAAALAGN